MNIMNKIRSFAKDESGAVTVDWVVLTAAVVILAIGAISVLDGAVDDLVAAISQKLIDYSASVDAAT